MKVKVSLLTLAAVSMLMLGVAFLRAKKAEHVPARLPVQHKTKVGLNALSSPHDAAVDNAGVQSLAASFSNENMPSDAKARLIEAALAKEDSQLNVQAIQLMREMVLQGSVSDVLAVLPKATFFSEETARSIAALQDSLCRFQHEDDLAFETIKMKFNLVFKNQAEIKPWSTVCRAG